ncbi:MAG: antibiotic biosynthesis monooxygenase [Nitrososphaera sp.]
MSEQVAMTMMETTDIDKFKSRGPDAIRVLAFFRAKKGRADELEQVLLGLVGPTRSEPGNIAYVLHRMDGDPDVLMFDEVWTSREALESHAAMPYMRSLPARIKGLAQEGPRVEVYREVRAAR